MRIKLLKIIAGIGVLSVLSYTALDNIVITTPKTSGCIIIHGDIDEKMVSNVKSQYNNLSDKDNVCVDLETNGGFVNSAIEIITFLDENSITTNMIVKNYAHSAGAFIMLSGTYLQMSPNALSVIHIPRLEAKGDFLIVDTAYNEVFNRAFLRHGRGAEVLRGRVAEYLSGRDVYMTGTEIVYNLHDFRYAGLIGKRYTYLDQLKFMLLY